MVVMVMNVISVSPCSGEFVEIDGLEWSDYIRYAEDNWMVRMGESWESLYSCGEVEAAYQIFQTSR